MILVTITKDDEQAVTVPPITHSPPGDPETAVEIPAATKRRLGLDDERSWIIVNEANQFAWPGPDLRPSRSGNPSSVAYGVLPDGVFKEVQKKFSRVIAKVGTVVTRTE